MDVNQYLEVFIEESREHLQELNESLLNIEKDPKNIDELNVIFRAAHTLKSMSATMGFNRMSNLTHVMEDVLEEIRNNRLQTDEHIINLLFKCLDMLEESVEVIVETSQEGSNDFNTLISELSIASKNISNDKPNELENSEQKIDKRTAVYGIDQYEESVILKAFEMDLKVFKITVILDQGCMLKAARAFIVFQTLEKSGEIVKAEPSVEDIEDEKFDDRFSVILIMSENKDNIADQLMNISEVIEVNVDEITEVNIAGDNSDSDHEDASKRQANKNINGHAKIGKTVRIDIERLDLLLNLVSELIIQKTRLEDILYSGKAQSYTETLEYLERITTNLHDAVMKVRMVPVENVFNRFPRMVRDLAKELNKEIDLVMSGQETELDRTVIDEIGDPLVHLIRNSADHGIEAVVERLAAGKPKEGNIYLSARHDGNNVVIEVKDDGNGINLENVRKSAVKKEICSEEESLKYDSNELIGLLFKPSFSTADKITDVSGRGVGLDVVKTKIESLGGSIEVETDAGKGTKFTIRLPLTLAIIKALLVTVSGEKYAIPLSSVNRIIKIYNSEIKETYNQKVFLLQEKVVPLIWLKDTLKLEDSCTKKEYETVVVIKKGDKPIGIVVDSYIGQQEIVIKPLGNYLIGVREIAGATILGDGSVALILDPNRLA